MHCFFLFLLLNTMKNLIAYQYNCFSYSIEVTTNQNSRNENHVTLSLTLTLLSFCFVIIAFSTLIVFYLQQDIVGQKSIVDFSSMFRASTIQIDTNFRTFVF